MKLEGANELQFMSSQSKSNERVKPKSKVYEVSDKSAQRLIECKEIN